MMVRPEYWIRFFEDKEYKELVEEKNRLVDFRKSYEDKASTDSWTVEDCELIPSLDVRYWFSLEYLSRLCALMHDKFEATDTFCPERRPGYNEHNREIRIKREPPKFNSYEWNDAEKRIDLFYDDLLIGWLNCDRYSFENENKVQPDEKLIKLIRVSFRSTGKSYDYLRDIDDVAPGDRVIVNGYDGETEVKVRKVFTKHESELGLPLNRYKKVVRKV